MLEEATRNAIFTSHFSNQFLALSKHPIANFPLQRFIENLPSPAFQLEPIVKELADAFADLLGSLLFPLCYGRVRFVLMLLVVVDGRVGVIVTLLNQASKLKLLDVQALLHKTLLKVFAKIKNVEVDDITKSITKTLLYLPKVEVRCPPCLDAIAIFSPSYLL